MSETPEELGRYLPRLVSVRKYPYEMIRPGCTRMPVAIAIVTILAGCDRKTADVPASDGASQSMSPAPGPSSPVDGRHAAAKDGPEAQGAPRAGPRRGREGQDGAVRTFAATSRAPSSISSPSCLGHDVDCVEIQKQAAVRSATVTQAATSPARPPPGRHPARSVASPMMVKTHPLRPAAHLVGKDEQGSERKCPSGTVPVRRVPLEELTAFKSMASFNRKSAPRSRKGLHAEYAFGETSKHEHAVFGAEDVTNHGAHAIFNIWSPPVEVESTGDWGEFSLAQLWVLGYGGDRPYDSLQSLEAGFQVWPEKYGGLAGPPLRLFDFGRIPHHRVLRAVRAFRADGLERRHWRTASLLQLQANSERMRGRALVVAVGRGVVALCEWRGDRVLSVVALRRQRPPRRGEHDHVRRRDRGRSHPAPWAPHEDADGERRLSGHRATRTPPTCATSSITTPRRPHAARGAAFSNARCGGAGLL